MNNSIWLSICLIFFINTCFALQKIFIFHINGINTTKAEALNNADELTNALNVQSNMISKNGQVDLLYNKMEDDSFCSLCKQLVDVWSQKHYENLSLDDFVIAYIRDRKLTIKPDTPEYTELKNTIKEKYFADPAFMGNNFSDILDKYHQKVIYQINTSNLRQFLKTYADKNDPKKPYILLIPHSQGNLYANNLYKELVTNEGFNNSNLNIYAIASPAAHNLGNHISKIAYNDPGYITSANDAVINALRIFAAIPPRQDILPANITIPSGHYLIKNYLKYPEAKEKIVNSIYNILHYYWLSDIYENLEQTLSGGQRILRRNIAAVMTQPANSTLSVTALRPTSSVMAHGSCPNLPYFVVKDNVYDNEIGSGTQCILSDKKTYILDVDDFISSNLITIRLDHGGRFARIRLKCFLYRDYRTNHGVLFYADNEFVNGQIGTSAEDQSCETTGDYAPLPIAIDRKATIAEYGAANLYLYTPL